MAITINGTGTITGISAGGLPDGIVDTDMLASGAITAAALPTGSILQVVQGTPKTDGFSSAATDYTNITGLSASITPSSTSSKVLVCFNIGQHDVNTASIVHYRITRGGSAISGALGTIASAVPSTISATLNPDRGEGMSMTYLDSPSTTDETTYQIQGYASGSDTLSVNFRQGSSHLSSISTVILMEVAG